MRIGLPKGHLFESTKELLEKSGIAINAIRREYKIQSNLKEVTFYALKPRDIPSLVEKGMLDAGIVGRDLVIDEKADVSTMLDLKTMPIYIVFAAKEKPKKKHIVVASEYATIAASYLEEKGYSFTLLKTHGSTECYVPDFADAVVDHVQTGETLKKNHLVVFDCIMKSTTNLIANKNMSKEKQEKLLMIKQMLKKGLSRIDLSYPQFPKKSQIINNRF